MRPLVCVTPRDYEAAARHPMAPFRPVLVEDPAQIVADDWVGQCAMIMQHPERHLLCEQLSTALYKAGCSSHEFANVTPLACGTSFSEVVEAAGSECVLRHLVPVLAYVGPGEQVPPSVVAQRARHMLPSRLRVLLDVALVKGNLYRWMVDRRALYSREPQPLTRRDTIAAEIMRLVTVQPELSNGEISARIGCDPTWPAKVRRRLTD